MEKLLTSILTVINDAGYEAYVVGGYVRDKIIGRESVDVDICTNATPKQVLALFNSIKLPKEEYGSVTVNYKGLHAEITTYRKDISYQDNRRPESVVYINDLKEDLLRRDFTMNTLCMDKDGNITDLLNGKMDIAAKKIKTVGDPFVKFEEDALRILRTIRFATILDFEIDDLTKKAIKKKRHLLKNISYFRKKEELDKIFSSVNNKRGIKLLLEFKLDKYLELKNLKHLILTNDIITIWSQLYNPNYPFSKVERETITDINKYLNTNILNDYNLYLIGPYISAQVGSLKGIDKKTIMEKYDKLAIKKRQDINISSTEICTCLNKKAGSFLKALYEHLEKIIVEGKIENSKEKIINYLQSLDSSYY